MQQPVVDRILVRWRRCAVLARSALMMTVLVTTLAACTTTPEVSASTPLQAASNTAPSASTPARPTAQEQRPTSSPTAMQSTPPAPTSTAEGATAIVDVAAADAQGRPMVGFTVVEDLSNKPVDCSDGVPNPSAVSGSTHDCSPHAANAHACWGATGSSSLVCSWDPRSTELRTYRSLEPLVDTAAATDPIPWAVDLANGLKCDLALGGAFGGRADGYHAAYTCDDKNTFVLANDSDALIDQDNPQWIVKTGGLSDDPSKTLPAPASVGVVTAYFAATGAGKLDDRARSTRA